MNPTTSTSSPLPIPPRTLTRENKNIIHPNKPLLLRMIQYPDDDMSSSSKTVGTTTTESRTSGSTAAAAGRGTVWDLFSNPPQDDITTTKTTNAEIWNSSPSSSSYSIPSTTNTATTECSNKTSLLSLFPKWKSIKYHPQEKDSNITCQQKQQDIQTITSSKDTYNYALLIALYTLQGIPIGLSASIPFLIQQKIMSFSSSSHHHHHYPNTYQAQAIFSFCSWPFSMKLLWAPLVDSIYHPKYGRRKSWLIPIQTIAALWMIYGSSFIEYQLGTSSSTTPSSSIPTHTWNIQGVTLYFLVLYFLMATQDVAVDGWAITMLSKHNRGKGPVCNSIGQNIGYLIAYVGFMALNDIDMSERVWRPILGLSSNPTQGLVTLGGFLQCMGWIMLGMTVLVALFKKEVVEVDEEGDEKDKIHLDIPLETRKEKVNKKKFNMLLFKKIPQGHEEVQRDDEKKEDDDTTSPPVLGVRETYQQLWAICQLPVVRGLFLILLTYRFPTSLSDNVKLLKAMEFGLSKQTIAWLTPLILLPLAIMVPIFANKKLPFLPHPPTALQQFLFAYKLRVTVIPILDMCMLWIVQQHFLPGEKSHHSLLLGISVFLSTALQAFVHNLQSNAQMSFFAQRVDPAIGGTYMTLLNTAANLGGTWPASLIMYLLGKVTSWSTSTSELGSIVKTDAYFPMQICRCVMRVLWLWLLEDFVKHIEHVPKEAWRTQAEVDDEWLKGKDEEGKPMLDYTKNR